MVTWMMSFNNLEFNCETCGANKVKSFKTRVILEDGKWNLNRNKLSDFYMDLDNLFVYKYSHNLSYQD